MNIELLNSIDSFVWGPPLLVLLVGTGIFLTLRLGFLQVSRLPKALQLIFKAENAGEGDIDSFKALCTALAATVGTGNIVGVATAVKAGGPGPSSGCGLPPSLVWQQNTRKVSLPSNTVRSMPKVRFPAVRCTTSNWAWGKSTNRLP